MNNLRKQFTEKWNNKNIPQSEIKELRKEIEQKEIKICQNV